jgi:hypothetical protein
MRGMLIAAGLCLCVCACGGEGAGDEAETGAADPAATWCCEVKAADGNARFSRSCGLTEDEAISWMRNPDEVCFEARDSDDLR